MPKGNIEKMVVRGLVWAGIGLLGLVAIFLLGATWEARQKERIAYVERTQAEVRYKETEERRETLTKRLDNLSTARGIEEEFRKRFPVVREGEEIIVFVDAEESGEEIVLEQKQSMWERVQGWFAF